MVRRAFAFESALVNHVGEELGPFKVLKNRYSVVFGNVYAASFVPILAKRICKQKLLIFSQKSCFHIMLHKYI